MLKITFFSHFAEFVGGLGSTWGPFIGVAAMMIVMEWMKEMGDARNIVTGLALILFVLFMPGGLAGGFRPRRDRIFNHGSNHRTNEGTKE